MKKNVVLIVLVLVIGILGYLLYAKNFTSTPQNGTANPTTLGGGKEINLSGKNLSEVSKDILDNKSITKLDVSNNNLTGALPAEIRKLTNLEVLVASNNKMTGIPAEIGQLSKLRSADFSSNNLSGLPLEIGNLNNLETLDLRGNPNISRYDIGKIQPKIPKAKILTD